MVDWVWLGLGPFRSPRRSGLLRNPPTLRSPEGSWHGGRPQSVQARGTLWGCLPPSQIPRETPKFVAEIWPLYTSTELNLGERVSLPLWFWFSLVVCLCSFFLVFYISILGFWFVVTIGFIYVYLKLYLLVLNWSSFKFRHILFFLRKIFIQL